MSVVYLLIALFLSAVLSGASLAYMKFTKKQLLRMKKAGNTCAPVILKLRSIGAQNQLHVTILGGNTLLNAYITYALGSIGTGLMVVIVSTLLIFTFAELIPQVLFNRKPLVMGKLFAPILYVFVYGTYIFSWPIGKLLDWRIGGDIDKTPSEEEFKVLVSELENDGQSPIDELEEAIILNTLALDKKTVREVMTPREDVILFEATEVYDPAMAKKIVDSKKSTFPIYSESDPNQTIGFLHIQDLLLVTHGTKKLSEIMHGVQLNIEPDVALDEAYEMIVNNPHHMCTVYENDELVGLITLEDIIEELLGREIEDLQDHQKNKAIQLLQAKKKVKKNMK